MTEPNTEIVPTADTQVVRLPPAPDDLVVLATNPSEMQHAQQQLLAWADRKMEILQAELAEAEQNLAECKKLKVKTAAWTRQVGLARDRITYYEKIRAAIAEGYYIVPNFPVQVIAIRTEAKKPPKRSTWGEAAPYSSESPPLGEGRHVAPEMTNRVTRHEDRSLTFTPTAFRDFNFPFQVVKPKVLSDLDHAMKLRIFDEIGILPAAAPAKRAVGGDPMLVGIIRRRENSGPVQTMFLISWWIDTRSL